MSTLEFLQKSFQIPIMLLLDGCYFTLLHTKKRDIRPALLIFRQ